MANGFWKKLFARFNKKTNQTETPAAPATAPATEAKSKYIFIYLEGDGRRLDIRTLELVVRKTSQGYFVSQVAATGQPLVPHYLDLSIKTVAELKRWQQDHAEANFVFWLVCEGKQTTLNDVLSVQQIPAATIQKLLDDPEIDDETLLGPLVKNHQ